MSGPYVNVPDFLRAMGATVDEEARTWEWTSDPTGRRENTELLRRLDGWTEGDHDTGPLIRWAAAHLRGCIELTSPSTTGDPT